jgi:hypothetical protein
MQLAGKGLKKPHISLFLLFFLNRELRAKSSEGAFFTCTCVCHTWRSVDQPKVPGHNPPLLPLSQSWHHLLLSM